MQKGCPLQETILPCRCLMRGEEYQIWCTHSNLPIVLDGLKAVAEYMINPIDELILENNILPSLPGRTFFPLKVLRLMLRSNGLQRVSSDWLAGLETTLVEIFIVEPELRSLPDDSMVQLNALQAITIQTNLLKRLPIFSGLPQLRYLQIESESLLDLSPTNFKNNPLLEKLHVTSSPRLTRLEANLLTDLPNLNLVNISFCGISWIHPRAISRLPVLKELWLAGNKITDAGMVGKGIRELPQLEIIRLDYNRINILGEATFVDLPALKKIYLSNNRITELQHGAFHRVPLLKSLDLNRNMLKHVHPESFLQQSGSGVEELSLVENDISHVAELRSLLDALPRLIFLDMSSNNLETVPFGTLRGHPTLEYLNLDFNKLHLIDREAFMAMPALRELRMKNNSLSDILEAPLWNLPALKGLDLSQNLFKKLKPNFLENLPLLRRVDLSSNELTVIDPTLFLLTPSLEHINVSHNHLSAIHPATFRHLINLYELDISYNNLREFVHGIPRDVEYLHLHHNRIPTIPPSPDLDHPSLRMLDLTSNRIETFPKGSFTSLPQLRRLYLGKNILQSLEESSLIGLTRLQNLDLQENRITQIHPQSFREITELKEINLRNNRLDILVSNIFKNTPNLKRLELSRNQLAEILPGTLDKNLDVQIIDASHNVLVQIPSAFTGLKHLRILILSNNRIKNIDSGIIGSLINLREIKLTNNFIQEVKQAAFNSLEYLEKIHLDNNVLEYIEPNAISTLPTLISVKLNRNKIKEIPNLAFNNLPLLQVLELQENELLNIDPNAFNLAPNLLLLNLSYNQLDDLERAGLYGLISLEMLDVSNNRISRTISPSLEKMEWLVELRMDSNEICGVQGLTFNGMPRLRVISLRNNKIMSFPEHAVERLRGNIAVFDIDGNPLVCDCNMLWLQAWLRELDQAGPHCIDGNLLRDIPLSRQDCAKGEKNSETVTPGCEAELLTAPELYKTSQVFSQWMNLKTSKNISKEIVGSKNQLAPSPEESDYFYDEYVDYPYNESLVDLNGLPNEKNKNKETVTVKVPLSTKSPHLTPGDTPTVYAAIKNRTRKPEIPQKVINSPSSSGFTFFGVPLPNLNQLLGARITGRMEGKQPTMPVAAQRKTAIVNNPIRNTGRSGFGNTSSKFPFNMQPPYIGNMQPPSLPEIQSGFVPILPGSGGFKPIPNPNFTPRPNVYNVTNISPKNNITAENPLHTQNPRDVIGVSPSTANTVNYSTQDVNLKRQPPSSSFNMTNNVNFHFPHVNQNISHPITNNTKNSSQLNNQKHVSQNLTNTPSNMTTKTIITEKKKKVATTIKIESEIKNESSRHDLVETVSAFVEEITDLSEPPTTSAAEVKIATNVSKIDKIILDSSESTKSVLIITTELPKEITTISPVPKLTGTAEIIVVPNVTTNSLENVHVYQVNENPSNEEPTESSPSALLIPESPQSQLKHGGRSTITKVFSPHISANAPLQSTLEVSRLSGPLPQREGKNSRDYSFAPTTERVVKDDVKSWYFANYNKTNLEPYVARITNSSRGIQDRLNQWYLQLLLYFCINIFLYQFNYLI